MKDKQRTYMIVKYKSSPAERRKSHTQREDRREKTHTLLQHCYRGKYQEHRRWVQVRLVTSNNNDRHHRASAPWYSSDATRTALPHHWTAGSSSTHTELSSTIEKRAERTAGAGLRGLAWPPPRRGAPANRSLPPGPLSLWAFLIFDFEHQEG